MTHVIVYVFKWQHEKNLLKHRSNYLKSLNTFSFFFFWHLNIKQLIKSISLSCLKLLLDVDGNLLPAGAVYIFEIVSAFSVYRLPNYLHVVDSCHFQLLFGPYCFPPTYNSFQYSLVKLGLWATVSSKNHNQTCKTSLPVIKRYNKQEI